MVEYRVEELAEEAGITVELLRSYQSKGLVPPPRHEGPAAWYNGRHLDRLRTIRDLTERGYSLRMIEHALGQGRRPAALDLDGGPEQRLTPVESRDRSRVPPALLRSCQA